MLTIFGKKKKDDSSVQIDTGTDAGQTSSQTPSMPPDPMQTQAPIPITGQNQPTTWPKQSVMGQTTPSPPPPSMRQVTPEPAQRPTPSQLPLDASFPSEETSLSRILQSLLQDIPRRASNHRAFRAHPLSSQQAHREHKLQRERLRLRQFLSLRLHRLSRNKTSLLKSLWIRLRKRTSPQRKLRLRSRKSLHRVSNTFLN